MENELEKTRKMFLKELLSSNRDRQWSPELMERMEKHDVGINMKEGTAYARDK